MLIVEGFCLVLDSECVFLSFDGATLPLFREWSTVGREIIFLNNFIAGERWSFVDVVFLEKSKYEPDIVKVSAGPWYLVQWISLLLRFCHYSVGMLASMWYVETPHVLANSWNDLEDPGQVENIGHSSAAKQLPQGW